MTDGFYSKHFGIKEEKSKSCYNFYTMDVVKMETTFDNRNKAFMDEDFDIASKLNCSYLEQLLSLFPDDMTKIMDGIRFQFSIFKNIFLREKDRVKLKAWKKAAKRFTFKMVGYMTDISIVPPVNSIVEVEEMYLKLVEK